MNTAPLILGINVGAVRPLQIAAPSRQVTARQSCLQTLGLEPEDLARFEGEGGRAAPEPGASRPAEPNRP